MDSLDPSKHNNFTPFITLTAEEYEAVKYKIPAGLIVILTDGSSPMAINGSLIPSSGGVITLDETFITTTDETANLPNSTNLGAIGTAGNNVLISTIATGESTLSAVSIPTTGLLTATSENGLQFTNNYVTGNQPITFNSGSSPHNITASTLELTGAQTISSTLSVGGSSTLAGVSATNISASGTVSSGGLLTAQSGFTQSGGNWSQTAGNHTYTNVTGSVLFTAQTVDLIGTAVGVQGQFTVNGSSILAGTSVTTLSASGAITSGGLLTGSSGFNLQSTGIVSTINCASNALNVTTSNLNVTGSGTFSGTLSAGAVTFTTLNATNISASGTLGVGGTSTLAGVNATSVSTTGSITSGTTLTASNGFVQTTGAHNVTTGNTASTISTGTAALNVTASTLALTGAQTISGSLGVSGTFTGAGINGTSLSVSNGLAQTGGILSLVTGNLTGSISTGTSPLNVTASSLNVTGAGNYSSNLQVSGALTVLGNSFLAGVNATSLATTAAISSGGLLTANNGFTQTAGGLNVTTGNTVSAINTGSAALNVTSSTLALTGNQTVSGYLSTSNGLNCFGGAINLTTSNVPLNMNSGTDGVKITTALLTVFGPASIQNGAEVLGQFNVGNGITPGILNVNNGLLTANVSNSGSIVLNSATISVPALTSSTGTNIVASGTNLYLQTSSRDFKNNIVDTTIDTSKVFNLRTVDYQYKATGQKSFGFIAEEVAEVLPDLVNFEEDKPFSINYSLLSVLLLEELKKVKTQLDSLTQKINSM